MYRFQTRHRPLKRQLGALDVDVSVLARRDVEAMNPLFRSLVGFLRPQLVDLNGKLRAGR